MRLTGLFCGVEILTYCVMSNHFHVLVRVPEKRAVSDAELLRRFKVLYPKPTKYQTAEFARLEKSLKEGNADTLLVRERLLARMHDLSEFMKTVKQRFSILGSQEFLRGFVGAWQLEKGRKHPPKPNLLRGADWQGLATIHGLRKQVFS